jgi:hypothetical protein
MSRGQDAGTLLEQALREAAIAAGCPIEIAAADQMRWASATFVGARHLLRLLGGASPALEAWLAILPDADFALRGHLVADLVVTRVQREGGAVTVSLEILTVEER